MFFEECGLVDVVRLVFVCCWLFCDVVEYDFGNIGVVVEDIGFCGFGGGIEYFVGVG